MYGSECMLGRIGLGSVGREIFGFLVPPGPLLRLERGSEPADATRAMFLSALNHFDGLERKPVSALGLAARGKR